MAQKLITSKPGRRVRISIEAKKILQQNRRMLEIKKQLGISTTITKGGIA